MDWETLLQRCLLALCSCSQPFGSEKLAGYILPNSTLTCVNSITKALNARTMENFRLSKIPSIKLTFYPSYPERFFYGMMSNPYVYQTRSGWTWVSRRMIQQLITYGMANETCAEVRPVGSVNTSAHYPSLEESKSVLKKVKHQLP